MPIYYNILYPPSVPISIPAFEVGKPTDTFRIFFEPSVGNKINDFRGGFIYIRNSETENNPGVLLYKDKYIPFRNPFAEYTDIKDPSRNIKQPSGYEVTIPRVERDGNGQYYIDVPQEIFVSTRTPIDVRYKMQIMLTTDWVSSTDKRGQGNIAIWEEDKYVAIDFDSYFSGNLVAKGLSEWSFNSLLAPVSKAVYELNIPGGQNIFSPIFEFVGSSIQDNLRNNSIGNYLKAYRINIYKAYGDTKEEIVDSSGWITGQTATNIEIRWQNIVELEDKTKYFVDLDIQTTWDLRKTFSYKVETAFEASLFRGKVSVKNDHDNARAKIRLDIKTPLHWGPVDNFDISIDDRDYAKVNGTVRVEEGIDFFDKQASIAGDMIISGITPIRSWEEKEDKWFFRLKGPELSAINPIQEDYSMYAYTVPLGIVKNEFAPFEDDFTINPVIEDANGNIYKTFLDTTKTPLTYGGKESEIGGVVTSETKQPSSHTYFYLKDGEGNLWKTTVTLHGEFVTEISHKQDSSEYIKPVAFYDGYQEILAIPSVDTNGVIRLDEYYTQYKLGENVRPMYINEFRFVKTVYGLELGRKKLISKQVYKAYMTDFNRKINKWNPISATRKYYMFFSSSKGMIRLIVRELTAGENQNSLDRYTMTAMQGTIDTSTLKDLFIPVEGFDGETLLSKLDVTGIPMPYVITSDEIGTLVAENGFTSASSTRSHDIRESDIEDLKRRGEIE